MIHPRSGFIPSMKFDFPLMITLALIAGLGITVFFILTRSSVMSQTYRADQSPQNRYSLVFSGDGIKTTLANALSARLAAKGITTTRIRAINYFWSARSPNGMAKDIQRQLHRRLKTNPDDRFLLIGYSFGAGTLPFALNRLPADITDHIQCVALLAPPRTRILSSSSGVGFTFRPLKPWKLPLKFHAFL